MVETNHSTGCTPVPDTGLSYVQWNCMWHNSIFYFFHFVHARKRVFFYYFTLHLLSFVIIVFVTVSVVHYYYNDEESEGSSDDDEDTRDMEGRTFTEAGMEVKFLIRLIISRSPYLISASWLTQISAHSFQIDRASAGNVKRSKEEVDADPEKENLFGYTMSESFSNIKKKTVKEFHIPSNSSSSSGKTMEILWQSIKLVM